MVKLIEMENGLVKAEPQKGRGNWIELIPGIVYKPEESEEITPQKKKRLRTWVYVVGGSLCFLASAFVEAHTIY